MTVESISFALDPTNTPSFLLDWEVTKLCNLDCSYCPTGVEWGSHDNSTPHPPLADCLKSIDFMYEYVDEYMKYKRPSQRKVVLNVYGGESLFHPNIVEILEQVRQRYEPFKDRWYLTVTCTTNAIVGKNLWARVVPLIDEFTVSYHAENLPKQKQQYLDNALYLKEHNKRFKCIIMMHNQPELFADSEQIIKFCQEHELRYVVKAMDNNQDQWSYTQEQFGKLKTFWMSKVPETQKLEYKEKIDLIPQTGKVLSIAQGRACCAGRQLSLNGDLKSRISFVPHQGFKGWSCSVNWFFLFVQQLTGNVYTNKDCRMSTTNRVEPLGNIQNSAEIISTLKTQFESNSMPIIRCAKQICLCGICAPKAETREDFMQLITRNVSVDVFQKEC
jgi:sulfatase maturation enzyme AslB (radical SAM superfamily)